MSHFFLLFPVSDYYFCCLLPSFVQSMSRSSKMLQYVNYRMRITILDGRVLVGTLMAFDRHLNLVSVLGLIQYVFSTKTKPLALQTTVWTTVMLVTCFRSVPWLARD